MAFGKQENKVEEFLRKVLVHDEFLSDDHAREVAFHLTDWLSDFESFAHLLKDGTSDLESAQATLIGLLIHAPAHVAAAAKIVTGEPVTDVFEIGAVQGDGIAKRQPGLKPPIAD